MQHQMTEKSDLFLSTKACKHILAVTQNKIMNMKMIIICLHLKEWTQI